MNFNGFSNKRINQLPIAGQLSGGEYLAIFQDNTLKRITISGVSAGTGSIEGGLATGGISGQFLKKISSTNYDSNWANITESDLPATVVQGLERMFAMGELNSLGGTDIVCDYAVVWAETTIKAIDIICPITPASGSIVIDIVYRAMPGGPLTSLYNLNTKPTLQCNGYASWATFTGSNLPDTTSLAQGSIVGFKIVSAPAGCEDLYVTVR